MNKSVLIIGLPGSGKTYLANTKYVTMGYILIDDPSNDKKMFLLMKHHLNNTKSNLVITDPYLCDRKNRESAISLLKSNGYEVECIYFENDVNKCKKLIKLRNDGRNIKTFTSFNYDIPNDVVPIKIYELLDTNH